MPAFLADSRCLENPQRPHHVAKSTDPPDQTGGGPVELQQHRLVDGPLVLKRLLMSAGVIEPDQPCRQTSGVA